MSTEGFERREEPDPASSTSPKGADLAREALRQARERARRSGSRPRWNRSGPVTERGGDPQLLGAALRGFLRERGWTTRTTLLDMTDRWCEVVGPDLGRHCRPESFEQGVLRVAADSSAWATQLRLLLPQLTARIREASGDVVKRVEVRGPTAPSWRRGPLRVRGPGPRDTYG